MSLRTIHHDTDPAIIDQMRGDRKLIVDFDGVIVNTALATIDAYRKAGAQCPWLSQVQHWSQWCSPEMHDEKNRIFIETCAEKCTRTPLYEYAAERGGMILSSCSKPAFEALKDAFKIDLGVLAIGLTKEQKMARLETITEPFFYMDDSIAFSQKVMKKFGTESVTGVLRKCSF